VFAAGGALGVGLSGVIADLASWRVAFAVIAVLAVACLLLCVVVVPESPTRVEACVDVLGAALLGVSLLAFMVAITEGSDWGWGSGRTVGLLAGSAVAALAWVAAELRVPEPMVQLRMLVHRPVLLANSAAMVNGVPLVAIGVLVPLFAGAPSHGVVDYGFDAEPTSVGWILFPSGFAGILSGTLGGLIIRRRGPRPAMLVGTALVLASYAYLLVRREGPWDLFVASALLGFGSPFNHAAVNTMLVTGVPASQSGVAMGMNTVMRSLGMVLGSQVSASILAADTAAGSDVPSEHGFVVVFALCLGLCVVAAGIALLTDGRRSPARTGPPTTAGASAPPP
jgi:predicted MFS family arabinose efflux permease